MRKLILPSLLVFALFAILTGCSSDVPSPTATPNTGTESNTVPDSPKNDGIDAPKPSFTAPSITIVDQTETTITVRVCGTGTYGAPAGFSLQWAVLGSSCDGCASHVWNDLTTCAGSFSGVPPNSRYNLSAGECVDIVVGDLVHDTGQSDNCDYPLDCGTAYVFRAFAHATSNYMRSPFTANLCGGTDLCAPVDVECLSSTSNSITVSVTAGAGAGAPGGITILVDGVATVTTDPLGPGESATITVPDLECGTSYSIQAFAAATTCFGASSPTEPVTCCTALCPPTITCYSATATSIIVVVTAGGGAGAPSGVEVYVDGVLYTTTGPLGAYEAVPVEIGGLECGTSHDVYGIALAADCYGSSDSSYPVTCCTNLCEPSLVCGTVTQTTIELIITTGGGAGAPGGVVIQWAELPDGVTCDAYDWQTAHEIIVTDPTQPVLLEGLECNTTYVFRIKAGSYHCYEESAYSPNVCCSTEECDFGNGDGCTRTRGFWSTHGPGDCHLGNNEDRISEFVGEITWCGGSVSATEACAILNATGGGCNQLGAQLMAALLNNAAFDTPLPACTGDAIAAYCSGTGCTEELIECLDDFNNSGHEHPDCPAGF